MKSDAQAWGFSMLKEFKESFYYHIIECPLARRLSRESFSCGMGEAGALARRVWAVGIAMRTGLKGKGSTQYTTVPTAFRYGRILPPGLWFIV